MPDRQDGQLDRQTSKIDRQPSRKNSLFSKICWTFVNSNYSNDKRRLLSVRIHILGSKKYFSIFYEEYGLG
jgi:hypothetical protein